MLAPGFAGSRSRVGAFLHGQVCHEIRRRRTVPVQLTWWGPDGVNLVHHDHLVRGDDEADAVGDAEGLSAGVVVPGGAGARGEADGVDPDPRRFLAADDQCSTIFANALARSAGRPSASRRTMASSRCTFSSSRVRARSKRS